MLSHDTSGGLFSNATDALLKNPANEDAKLFSVLQRLNSFRLTDGTFHLKLCYPELTSLEPLCNEWSQTSNPATDSNITGFHPIHIAFSKNSCNKEFGGLGLSPASDIYTLIDDAPDQSRWYNAIGAYQSFLGAQSIPGPTNGSHVKKVELFAETPRKPVFPVVVLAGGVGVGVLLILVLVVMMARKARDWFLVEENTLIPITTMLDI